MIRLEVEDYCKCCRYFDPVKEVIDKQSFSDATESKLFEYETIVTCRQQKRCANMYKVLKKRFEEEHNDRNERCE